ncbi:MAG: PH domain-containing protein [bacterium]|nr:PH domain-containing protein [bacterium]
MRLGKRITLRDGERVQEVLRRSLLVPAPFVLLGTCCIVLAFFLLVPLFAAPPFGLVGFALLIALGILFASRAWWFWYRTAFIVTNQRIIDFDQTGFFRRHLAEARFDRIEDISVEVHGIIATLFRLGTVHIQTAGASAMLSLRHVPHPEHVHEMLGTLQQTTTATAGAARGGAPVDVHALPDDELIRLRERIAVELRQRDAPNGH